MSAESNLVLPLSRPQYVVAAEVLLSTLARRAYTSKFVEAHSSSIGFTYKKVAGSKPTPRVWEFFPRADTLATLDRDLQLRGLILSVNDQSRVDDLLADAARSSVLGIRSKRGNSQPASPLTPALALMQDLPGLLNKRGPADIGGILESIFMLGSGPPEDRGSAALRLRGAYARRLKVDPLLAAFDASFQSSILGEGIQSNPGRENPDVGHWNSCLEDTPFSWFHDMWITITSEEWVDALPARVWVDWATTVLRLGLGMAYLWEASWYESIASTILRRFPDDASVTSIRAGMADPLPWESRQLAPKMRAVAGILKRRIGAAHGIRDLLVSWEKDHCASENAGEQIRRMAEDSELRTALVSALNPKESVGKNTWEAVSYLLAARETAGDNVDYYGLLKRRGPSVLEPAPGVEWTAVIASLTCGRSRPSCDVGELLDRLSALGARPSLRDLISYLEAAGLARGSADADRGVRVERAY